MAHLVAELDHFEIGKAAVADFAAGGTTSDVVNCKDYLGVRFIVHWGVGATGVIKCTVLACDDVTPSNTAAIPFFYRINKGGTLGALTRTTAAAGVSNVAGSNQVIECIALVEELAASGYGYMQLNVAETTDDPLLGGILIQMIDYRHASGQAVSALT